MSRLLDMLRRPRRDGPPPWDEPAHEADLHNHSTAAARAIVLDTLSGVRRRAPWYRRRLTFVLAALGLAAVVFCVMAIGRRPAGDRPATLPPRDSRSA